MTLHLTSAQERKLQDFAAQSDRTPDELAQTAVDRYLSYLEELAAAVREGEESAEREGWIPHEQVVARIKQRTAGEQRPTL